MQKLAAMVVDTNNLGSYYRTLDLTSPFPGLFLFVSHCFLRKVYNHLFLRKVNMAHQSRLQRARMAGERAVQQDLPEFEARSREAARTGSI